jgi:uncharacterized protein (DUF2267 family)
MNQQQREINQTNRDFLAKIQQNANLDSIYDARDLTEIVYRVMRDLMTTDAADRVKSELNKEAIATDNKTLQVEISELWKDRNPIVALISRVRPPLDIDDELFIRRVEQEGGVPRNTTGEQVIKAVFSATKAELSPERIQEITSCLPGKIQQIWQQA